MAAAGNHCIFFWESSCSFSMGYFETHCVLSQLPHPTHVGEAFCVSCSWLFHQSACGRSVFRSAVAWRSQKQCCGNEPDKMSEQVICRQCQTAIYLPVGNRAHRPPSWGELALTFKTPCENYTVCKKCIACSFTRQSQVPPVHQSTIRNKTATEEFNSMADNFNKTDIPELARITWQLWHKVFAKKGKTWISAKKLDSVAVVPNWCPPKVGSAWLHFRVIQAGLAVSQGSRFSFSGGKVQRRCTLHPVKGRRDSKCLHRYAACVTDAVQSFQIPLRKWEIAL